MPLRVRQKIQAVPRQAQLIRLKVAAGILIDADGRVLVAERLGDGAFHGMWEFPGGKLQDGESAQAALARELAEEIGIEGGVLSAFMSLEHEYPDRHVTIDFFVVSAWRNEPRGLEGQALRWLAVDELDSIGLLPADAPVVEALKRGAS